MIKATVFSVHFIQQQQSDLLRNCVAVTAEQSQEPASIFELSYDLCVSKFEGNCSKKNVMALTQR